MTVRCKFRCMSSTDRGDAKDFEFMAVTSGNSEEDKKFHKWTPAGKLTFSSLNPDVNFKPGKDYYLDITEAPT